MAICPRARVAARSRRGPAAIRPGNPNGRARAAEGAPSAWPDRYRLAKRRPPRLTTRRSRRSESTGAHQRRWLLERMAYLLLQLFRRAEDLGLTDGDRIAIPVFSATIWRIRRACRSCTRRLTSEKAEHLQTEDVPAARSRPAGGRPATTFRSSSPALSSDRSGARARRRLKGQPCSEHYIGCIGAVHCAPDRNWPATAPFRTSRRHNRSRCPAR